MDIHVDEYLNQLFDISSEFEEMPTKNIFETVTIEVHVDASSRSGVDWCRLDEIFTTPGWFSLKRVSLVIDIRFISRINKELEGVLRKLPETQFPRFSSSNSVSFDFKIIS